MIDVSSLSGYYNIRKLSDPDIDSILELCEGNPQFYLYCDAKPTREQLLRDLQITPPGVERSGKYCIGFIRSASWSP